MKKLEQRVPNLRFKGFTDDWEQHKLGDIAKVTKLAGFEFTKYINYSSKGKILAIRGLNIKDGKFNLQDVKYIDNSDFNKLTRSKLRQDDILFTYVGTIGNSAIVPAGVKWYLAPNVCLIRTQTENAKFISHLIQSDKFQHQEIPKWITTSSQPALSMENIRKFSIILPTISEQLKISNLVSIIDTIITLQQRKLDLLKQLKKGFLQKMFADKDSKQPVLRFKGFHDDWEQRKLGEISTSFSGGTPSVKNKSYYGGKIPFIRSAEIHKDKTELFITESGLKNSSAKLIKKGTLLYALYGATSGEVDVSNIDGAINQAIIAIFLQKDNVSFIKYYLEKNKDKIIAKYLQGGQGNLSASIIKSVHINLPFTEEQLKISNLIKKVESLIFLQQQKLAKYQSIKKSLLQQMFI